MNHFNQRIQSGQSLVEYALLLMLVSSTIFLSLSVLGNGVSDSLDDIDFDGDRTSEDGLHVFLLDQDQTGIPNGRIYAYLESGEYTDIYQDTNSNGETAFTLEPNSYLFLTEYQGEWFWSDLVQWPEQSTAIIQIERTPFIVTTIDLAGNPIRDVPISAFDAAGNYLNATLITNVRGEANFNLIGENVEFRADYEGEAYYSDLVPLAQGNATITLDICQEGQFRAEYFNNRTLADDPVLIRCESEIQYEWGRGSPAAGVNSNRFSVRWTGYIPLDSDTTYAFTTTADDGVRIVVDDETIIDAWRNQAATTYTARKETQSVLTKVVMSYYENGGNAVAKLNWTPVVTLNCPDNQFLAEYFNNRNLSGEPVFSRCESQIDYSWGTNSPGNGVNADNFSIRWRGNFSFEDGDYAFTTTADDGVRIWVDGEQLIDRWVPQSATTYSARKSMAAGNYVVQMEYYERGGNTRAYFSWETITTSCPTGQFFAEYYNNLNLSGDPVFARCESQINYNWGSGSPGFGVNSNNFSVRWSGDFDFSGGNVTFTTRTDDGVQLYVDQNLIINQWRNQSATTYQSTQTLSAGTHQIMLVYFERGGQAVAEFDWE